MTFTRRLWPLLALLVGVGALSSGWIGLGPAGILLAATILPVAMVTAAVGTGASPWAATITPIALGCGGALAAASLSVHRSPFAEPGRAVRELLAAPHPAPATAELLLPGLLVCVLVGTVVGVRLEIAHRGQVAGIAGGAVLYLAAQLLSAGTADRHGILAASLMLVALLGWLPQAGVSSREGSRYAGPKPSHLSAALALVLLVPLGFGALGGVGGFQPRDHVRLPRVTLNATDPLALLAIWTSHPDLQLVKVQATGTDRLHVATLGDYDGTSWSPSGSFQPVDAYAAPDLPLQGLTTIASATVQVVRLGGPLLPTTGATRGVSRRDGLLDPDSGDVALTSGVVPGLTYTVQGPRETPTPAALSQATVPTVPATYLSVPTPPPALLAYAQKITADATTPLQQAVAIEAAISLGRSLAVSAPGGSSYARISTFLFRPASEGGQLGTSEQFATSFALLARLVGLPSRLVVGLHLPSTSPAEQTVIGKDARAWPELYLGGAGWVAFDPTPGGSASADAALRQKVLTDVNNAAKKRAAMPTPASAPAQVTPATTARPDAPAKGPWRGIGIGLLVVVVAVGLGLLVLRLLRRSRRRAAGAPGAWAEVLELARRVGRRPPPGYSASTIAAGFGEVSAHAGKLAQGIAQAAEAATFAPARLEPDAAWEELRDLKREVRREVPLRRRLPHLAPGSRRRR